ncbi:MAG: hypothetical protein Q9M91_04875 [Candidatus Dojkabacteria bacterium]|nr:hypothetical protein [Candidatus Dojkabacteria bacterium]MDQ7021142.1 hypothetical protein [Candidatus Dojkabacteria bacterium]
MNDSKITNFSVSARAKGYGSTFRKVMKKYVRHNEGLTEDALIKVKDLIGIRVLVEEVETCYLVLGLIQKEWNRLD